MNKVIGYLSQYFGNKDLSDYPGLLRKTQQKNLDCAIVRASYSVLFDTADEPRAIDWRSL